MCTFKQREHTLRESKIIIIIIKNNNYYIIIIIRRTEKNIY